MRTQTTEMGQMDAQTEITRLREEVAELRKALADRQLPQPATPQSLPALRDNYEFITDLARFADGTLEEKYIRRKYHLVDEATWTALEKDNALVERIEEEKLQRIRSGATKRERAQKHIVAAPEILNGIMSDPKANHRHVVDAIKTLDTLAANGPQAAPEQDRVTVVIRIGKDEPPLVIDATVKPTHTIVPTREDDSNGDP